MSVAVSHLQDIRSVPFRLLLLLIGQEWIVRRRLIANVYFVLDQMITTVQLGPAVLGSRFIVVANFLNRLRQLVAEELRRIEIVGDRSRSKLGEIGLV